MDWRRVGMTFAVIIPILALLAFGMTRDPRALPSVLPGQPAADFSLAVMDNPDNPEKRGQVVDLAAHRGDVVVINFWASWCLACRTEHRALSNVAERYRGKGVQFYGMLYNDSPPNAVEWIRNMGGQSYPTLLDPSAGTAIDYGLYGVPETFFIGPDGTVAYKHVGPVTEELLTEWIEKLRVPTARAGEVG